MKRIEANTLLLPVLILAAVVMLALVLLTIVARSPFTHSNWNTAFDPGYTRTDQTLLGPPLPFEVLGLTTAAASDPAQHGKQLFVVDGCAACHGMDGRGGIIGPPISGTTAKKLRTMTRQGPKGMPSYSTDTLSDADLVAIAAFLSTSGQ